MPDDERTRIAREALHEITPAATVGELLEQTPGEDGVTTLAFATTMSGYPGWRWTVSVMELPGEGPSVLEAELLPGEGSLLAPDWVPWAERLEELRAAQAAEAGAAGTDEDAEDELDPGDPAYEDFGDDPDDGIDFEDDALGDDSAAAEPAPVGVEEADEAEADADEAGPQPPDAVGLDERGDEDQ